MQFIFCQISLIAGFDRGPVVSVIKDSRLGVRRYLSTRGHCSYIYLILQTTSSSPRLQTPNKASTRLHAYKSLMPKWEHLGLQCVKNHIIYSLVTNNTPSHHCNRILHQVLFKRLVKYCHHYWWDTLWISDLIRGGLFSYFNELDGLYLSKLCGMSSLFS